jgi:hypothetical protein
VEFGEPSGIDTATGMITYAAAAAEYVLRLAALNIDQDYLDLSQ